MSYFWAIAEEQPGEKWASLFEQLWPGYKKWYTSEGLLDRPTYLECSKALKEHMPEILPLYEALCALAGGGDVAARFLSLYNPPAYISACSQAIWPGHEPLLVRNYDYSPFAFDGVILKTCWQGRSIMGMSDCLIGFVDGVNDAGLCLSLTFGGSRHVGHGFGIPIIMRYVLETCETASQAAKTLARLPSHMAYNVTALDAKGHWRTVHLSPGRDALVTELAVATNHQEQVEWQQHARATATIEREHYLLQRLIHRQESAEDFISAFLKPPLYSLAFARGFGTLYTAAYWAEQRRARFCWPGVSWELSLTDFQEGGRQISFPDVAQVNREKFQNENTFRYFAKQQNTRDKALASYKVKKKMLENKTLTYKLRNWFTSRLDK